MPSYSLFQLVNGVKYEMNLQGLMPTEFSSTQKLLTALGGKQGQYVRYCSETETTETGVKVPKVVLSVSKGVSNLRH